ncbi:thymidylate kinase-like [Xenia sp. Carnegie-2017]|uniref:thymidylate kinase-like n=1 Tax=Xenia sp. Carnegie-2017 TaxID=2897299 RepID=UPI001F04A962|nr:thymidylate kinase-like [Xenia sp. Carnegie-2017]
MSALSRGAMIVFEGCDRCGKSTQSLKLVDYLQSLGRRVQLFRFPDRSTDIGKTIDSYLQRKSDLDDHAVHLMFSANRWEMRSKMKALLEEGITLIVDRYAYSGVAFTTAKHHFNLEWCKMADSGLIAPDVVLFLDLPLEEAAKRGKYGDERYENLEFQRKVSDVYSRLKEQNWKILNASQSIDDLQDEIREIVEDVMNNTTDKKLQTLWPLNTDF